MPPPREKPFGQRPQNSFKHRIPPILDYLQSPLEEDDKKLGTPCANAAGAVHDARHRSYDVRTLVARLPNTPQEDWDDVECDGIAFAT